MKEKEQGTEIEAVEEIGKELVHVSRLGLSGRSQDLHLYLQRLIRRFNSSAPGISESLTNLLREAPTQQSPLRSAAAVAMPIDSDSRLQLARTEYPVKLDREPIMSSAVRQAINQIVSERKQESELYAAGLHPTRTAIFIGPPGVGKTMTARWIASKLERPLIILDLSAVMSSYLGRTGANVRHVLDYAKSVKCVLLLDEIDAIAKRRDDTVEIGELKRLVTVLLQEIDDWPSTGMLLAATNHQDLLDPAVWRRFEMIVEFALPTLEQTQQAVALSLGDIAHSSPALAAQVSVALRGLSFSEIERELLRLRREAIIFQKPLEDGLRFLISSKLYDAPRDQRMQIAVELVRLGISQREAHEITGVSRDTIRKHAKAQEEL